MVAIWKRSHRNDRPFAEAQAAPEEVVVAAPDFVHCRYAVAGYAPVSHIFRILKKSMDLRLYYTRIRENKANLLSASMLPSPKSLRTASTTLPFS